MENVSQGTSGLLFERTTATSSMNLDAWNAVENWHLAPISRVADCFLEGKSADGELVDRQGMAAMESKN